MSSSAQPPRRGRLKGSDELFRDTRHTPPPDPPNGSVSFAVTPEELRWIVDALQLARFPELHRQRPTMTQYEQLGELQDRLRKLLEPPSEG